MRPPQVQEDLVQGDRSIKPGCLNFGSQRSRQFHQECDGGVIGAKEGSVGVEKVDPVVAFWEKLLNIIIDFYFGMPAESAVEGQKDRRGYPWMVDHRFCEPTEWIHAVLVPFRVGRLKRCWDVSIIIRFQGFTQIIQLLFGFGH